MFRIALTAAAASLAVSSAEAARPSADGFVASERVSYADLDIRSAAGAGALMQRIARAANTVCGARPDGRLYDDRIRFDRCRIDAAARAVRQVGPNVASAYPTDPASTIVSAGR